MSVERLWQNYFENPAEWWDNRNNKLHPLSPDFRHKTTKEALWVSNWNTPKWVMEALASRISTRYTCEGISSSGTIASECRSGGLHSLSSPQKNAYSWNLQISQHTKNGQARQALRIYEEMKLAGVNPISYTFVAALKACGSLHDLGSAQRIHTEASRSGLESDLYVGNSLVDVYAKCGSLIDARLVFDKMPHRDVVSWNTIIWGYAQLGDGEEALQLYARMRQDGVEPNDRTYVGALKACSRVLAAVDEGNSCADISMAKWCLERTRTIHSDAVKGGFESDIFVGNLLVNVYSKCGSLADARKVFDRIQKRNVVSWTCMILGYAQMEMGEEALQLYARMQQEGVSPNHRTFVGALKACSYLATSEVGHEVDGAQVKHRCLEQVKAIHSHVMKYDSKLDIFVGTMLVTAYVKCGNLVGARHVFNTMHHRDCASWNAIILGYAQMEMGEEALSLYFRMQQEGIVPDDRTFVGVLKAVSGLVVGDESVKEQCLEQARAVHSEILKRGCASDIFVGTMLVDVYSKCGSMVDARCVFEQMPHRDVVSWNAIIMGYAQVDEGEEALRLYARMQDDRIVPGDRTFVGALKACGVVAGLEKGREIHTQISNTDAMDSFVASSLLDMYGKCGSMDEAEQLFQSLTTRDTVEWSTLIAGYARQGKGEVVFDLFLKMMEDGVQPNGITFLSILNVCNHLGLLDKGQMYFEIMRKDYAISPTFEHYSCMVDLLGRAGRLDEAIEMVNTMPFQPTVEVWRCLLGACRKWKNVELGKKAFESAVALDMCDAAAYVLMSNIYAAADMWEESNRVQADRLQRGALKQPGLSSWTDTRGIVHSFVVGEHHPNIQNIQQIMQDIIHRIEARYIPHLDVLVSDIPGVTEIVLCGHSRALDHAYNLLKMPRER